MEDHKPKQPTKAERKEHIERLLKLLDSAVAGYMFVTTLYDDPFINNFVSRSTGHLWEARYWITEILAYLEEQEKQGGSPSVKAD